MSTMDLVKIKNSMASFDDNGSENLIEDDCDLKRSSPTSELPNNHEQKPKIKKGYLINLED
jgi:hypothetical protein